MKKVYSSYSDEGKKVHEKLTLELKKIGFRANKVESEIPAHIKCPWNEEVLMYGRAIPSEILKGLGWRNYEEWSSFPQYSLVIPIQTLFLAVDCENMELPVSCWVGAKSRLYIPMINVKFDGADFPKFGYTNVERLEEMIETAVARRVDSLVAQRGGHFICIQSNWMKYGFVIALPSEKCNWKVPEFVNKVKEETKDLINDIDTIYRRAGEVYKKTIEDFQSKISSIDLKIEF